MPSNNFLQSIYNPQKNLQKKTGIIESLQIVHSFCTPLVLSHSNPLLRHLLHFLTTSFLQILSSDKKLDCSGADISSSFITGNEGKQSIEFTSVWIGLPLKNDCDLKISETYGVHKYRKCRWNIESTEVDGKIVDFISFQAYSLSPALSLHFIA